MEPEQQLAEIAKYEKKLTDEFEWKQSINTFTSSSDRGRYLMVVVIIASFFSMICWLDSREESWIAGRVTHARRAIQYQVWDPASPFRSSKDFAALKHWAENYNLFTKELLTSYLSRLEEMESLSAYSVRIPILGISFDINDLGSVGGLCFLFLTLALLASTYREHENLYLCLWKVEMVSREEPRPDLGGSQSNLLYHALAMAQVFANPPTLARWRRNRLYYLPYVIFFLPVIPESLILANDLATVDIGKALSRPATYISLGIQISCLVLGLVASVFCVLYERSAAIRWRSTFYLVNPKYRCLEQPLVRDWLFLSRSRPRIGRAGADGMLSSKNKKTRLSAAAAKAAPTTATAAARIALIFDGTGLPQWSDAQLAELLAPVAGAQEAWIRIAIDGKVRDDGRHYGASRSFLRKWRANELAFAVVDRTLEIAGLSWRWDVETLGGSVQSRQAAVGDLGRQGEAVGAEPIEAERHDLGAAAAGMARLDTRPPRQAGA